MGVSYYSLGLLRTDPAMQERFRGGADLTAEQFSEQLDSIISSGRLMLLAVNFLAALLWIAMGYYNGRGKSWARTAATTLGVLGIVFSATGLVASGDVAGLLSGLLSIALALAVLILIYRPESARYYDEQDAVNNPAA